MISSSTILSVFEVGEKVAETPRTAIYRGRHLESGRDAAIKLILLSGLPAAEDRRRTFEERARPLLELRNPGLPTTLDLGRTEEGDVFLAFEWVDGQVFGNGRPWSAKERVDRLITTLEGLRALSDRGLALLGLRPSNLFLRANDSLMVTGLGTALANPDRRDEGGTQKHKDRYVAPEVRGLRAFERPDLWRADVFSFAITAVELFGGSVRGAGGPVPYVKLPGELERLIPSIIDLAMLLERSLHQRPERRPELAPLLNVLQLCAYDLDKVGDLEKASDSSPAGERAGSKKKAQADFEAKALDENQTMSIAATSARPDEEEELDPLDTLDAHDDSEDSIVGSLRKMWSEGLADIDLKKGAKSIDSASNEPDSDPVISDQGTLVSADQSGELDLRDQPLPPIENPDEILDIPDLTDIGSRPVPSGIRRSARQPRDRVAEVADQFASLLGESETATTETSEGDAAAAQDSGESGDLRPAERPDSTAEIDVSAIPRPAADASMLNAEQAERRPEENTEESPEENTEKSTEEALPEPALAVTFDPPAEVHEPQELRIPQLSEVDSVLVEMPSEPQADPYRIPFFIAAAAAGLLLIAFLWQLFEPVPSFDPDLSQPVELAEVTPADSGASLSEAMSSEGTSLEGIQTPGVAPGDTVRGTEDQGGPPASNGVSEAGLPASVIADLPGQPGTAIPTDLGRGSPTPEVPTAESGAQTAPSSPSAEARSETPVPRGAQPRTRESPPSATAEQSRTESSSQTPRTARLATTASGPRSTSAATPGAPTRSSTTVREIARDSLTPLRADLDVALKTGNLVLLRSTLNRLTPSDRAALESDPQGRASLEFARLVSSRVDDVEAALAAGRGKEALAEASRLSSQFPAIENSLGLRDRAARWIEAESERLVAAGRLDEARARLRELEQNWPTRDGLGSRLQLVDQLQADARSEVALAEIQSLERDRLPHAALERLAEAEPSLEGALGRAQVDQLRSRLESLLTQLDRQPPRLELSPFSEVELAVDQPLAIRIRAEDDYLVKGLAAYVRRTNGDEFREIETERLGSRVFRIVVPPEIHGNGRFFLWAEAVDYQGHAGRLGSPEAPIKVKPQR